MSLTGFGAVGVVIFAQVQWQEGFSPACADVTHADDVIEESISHNCEQD